MRRIILSGNPNVGKSTLFNSLTHSNAHTGNFHGVTTEEERKIVNCEGEDIEFLDIPGLYSLNATSQEEDVSTNILLNDEGTKIIILDANNLKKNLYLCVQLCELGIKFKVVINNLDYFEKHGNKFNLEKFKKNLNLDAEIVNAKKAKISKKFLNEPKNCGFFEKLTYLNQFIQKIQEKFKVDNVRAIEILNGINTQEIDKEFLNEINEKIIQERHKFIDKLLDDVVEIKQNYVYGYSKLDKLFTSKFSIFLFAIAFLLSIYLIFFVFGAFFSEIFEKLFNFLIVNPIVNLICTISDNIWLIEFISNGVLSSISTVLGFVPQVCLLFVFLTILEDSGLIARLSYLVDDLFSKVGLNGKAIYTMLLGLGCNTMSTMATRNMPNKNMKIKTALINPYVSCMARLPVFILLASAFFGKRAFLVVSGLYLLGLIVALILSTVLDKTILPTKDNFFLLEFPPLRAIDFVHVFKMAKKNILDFTKRVFGTVLMVGIIVFILSHTKFNFSYTQDIDKSILFILADKVKFLFAPIGLNNAGVVCALFVGLLAKELIVSTFATLNSAHSQSELISSLLSKMSVVNMNKSSAISFLIFVLLYSPCVSNLAVLKRETDKFFMWFSLISQIVIAYTSSFVAYQFCTKGFGVGLLVMLCVAIIMFAIVQFTKKITTKNHNCLMCGKCGKH